MIGIGIYFLFLAVRTLLGSWWISIKVCRLDDCINVDFLIQIIVLWLCKIIPCFKEIYPEVFRVCLQFSNKLEREELREKNKADLVKFKYLKILGKEYVEVTYLRNLSVSLKLCQNKTLINDRLTIKNHFDGPVVGKHFLSMYMLL